MSSIPNPCDYGRTLPGPPSPACRNMCWASYPDPAESVQVGNNDRLKCIVDSAMNGMRVSAGIGMFVGAVLGTPIGGAPGVAGAGLGLTLGAIRGSVTGAVKGAVMC